MLVLVDVPGVEVVTGTERMNQPAVAPERASSNSAVPTSRPRPWLSLVVVRAWHGALVTCRFFWRRPTLSIPLALLATAAVLGIVWGVPQLRASHNLRAARSASQRYLANKALEHAEACLRVWPKDAEALFLTARARRRLGEFEEATASLQACEHAPHSADEVSLERLLLRTARGEPGANVICQAMLSKGHPARDLLFEALIFGYMHKYRFREAGFLLEQWLKADPDNSQAHMFHGLMHFHLQNQPEAIKHFEKAVEIDAERQDARLLLAGLLLDIKDPQKAHVHLDYLHERQPNNTYVQVRLARCLEALGKQEEAIELLDKVLVVAPHQVEALVHRAMLARHGRDLDKAEALLKKARALEPGNYAANYQLFLCLSARGKSPLTQELRRSMAQIEEDLMRVREIIGKTMQRTPRDPALQYELGTLLMRTGQIDEGLRWLHSAVQEDPKHTKAHEALADHYDRLGQVSRAARHRSLAKLAALEKSTSEKGAAPNGSP